MIKTVLNAVLVVAILVMGFLLCKSIQKPIAFGDAKDKRQAAVIKKLVDIRKAQECFKENYGHYTADFDSLKTFVKEGQKKVVEKRTSRRSRATSAATPYSRVLWKLSSVKTTLLTP